ncbi:SusC/RagA family TonB-linked outer membrane protein [Christiangramia marina]|uniref:SusC/RagA family TonB-linked outer membrane protein n=1 Tax=Christiangramia marina TaxID=409436 RepID=UPI003AA98413
MNLKKTAIFLMALICHLALIAQESYSLSGTVISEGDAIPLAGVSVVIKGTTTGVVTDFDGNYEIDVVEGNVLQFSYLGFVSQEITYNGQQTLDVSMASDSQLLDETVVIGYGTRKKSHLTGAVSSVVNEDLDQLPVARVDDALVGQISGVNIQATDGQAGAAPTIRIRGTGSLTGSSAPLIVVDGLVVDNDFLGSLDMSEVASFDVLKDAASAAIYGSRGGNGVILITTKQGKEGKTVFSYQGYSGYKEARQSDAYYFSVAETSAAELAATGELSPRTQYIQAIGIDRDWQDDIFDGGLIQNHSLSARGGTENTKFSISLGYLHDEGVLLTDDYKRYNLRLKLDTKVSDKFRFGGNLAPSYTDTRRFDGSTHDILRQPPWLPIYHDENTIQFVDRNVYPDVEVGDYAVQRHFDNYDLFGDGTLIDISDTSNTNPAAKVLERDRNDYKFKVFGNFYADYEIMDDLNLRTTLSGDYQHTMRDRWQGVLASRNGASDASYNVENERAIHIASETYLTYDKTFGEHEFDAVAGITFEQWDYEGSYSLGTGYTSDLIRTLSAATVASEIDSWIYDERFQSYFARLNWAYADKYLASFSYRRDGSSVFGSDSKYGDFPAISLGWDIAEENFLKDNDFLSSFKFRVSYGFTGNKDLDTNSDIIDLYPSLPLLGPSSATIGGAVQPAFVALNIANPDLQWERSQEVNPGLDFGFFKNRITGSVDYYKRTSDQLLLFNPISASTGFRNALVNIGEVENSGVEVELRTRNFANANFGWNTTILASRNKNELTDFADSNGQIGLVDDKRAAEWINLEGQPISSFYGWVVDRDIPRELRERPYFPIGAEAQDVYVKDLNGDGVIDDDDKTILGNPYPDLIWSLTNEFRVGNLDISFLFQGSHGAEVRNMGDQYIFNHFNSGADFDPAITPDQDFIREKIFTDDIVQDASYVALRNVNIGYNIPVEVTGKLGLKSLRVYAAGQNLKYWTADDYTGFNPESIDNTSPTTYGYQRAGSPIFRTISIGINADF